MYSAPLPVIHRQRPRLGRPPGAGQDEPARGGARTPRGAGRLDFSGERGERLRAALASVHDLCPEFSPVRLLADGTGRVVVAGTAGRRAVVATCVAGPPDAAGSAADGLRRDIAAHRLFVRHRPPVRVPRLIADDPYGCVLVTEFVAGRQGSAARHPGAGTTTTDLRMAFNAVCRVNAWRPPVGAFPDVVNYPARVARYHAMGLLTDRDAGDLGALLRALTPRGHREPPRQFCHGGELPDHVLLSPAGPVLVGWDAAGWYLPGYDLARLWTALPHAPGIRRLISQTAQGAGPLGADAFLVNLMLVLTREIRHCEEAVQRAMRHPGSVAATGQEHAPGGVSHGERRRRRLRRLYDDWAVARKAVRAAVGAR
ncbi:aminoglycoside phosphotransferase family protein [Streptomyces sp. PT12]|uniref:aminoglycoside phosphotransferase family protein n=1 Tax=Streptomyces sp. PT12 TaxID=1510197 RepID=UPI000DE3C4E4|nr:aminoglycoside phosphotransferase family protein [Streptomyces sp. PT12]RBM24065.1 phosphotransferase [Streptomyces sp. PT12]